MTTEPDDRYAEKNLLFRSPTAGGLLECYKGRWFRHIVPCPPEYQKQQVYQPTPLDEPNLDRNGRRHQK